MFVEFTSLRGGKISINPRIIWYAIDSGDGHTLLFYGPMTGNFLEIAEDYDTAMSRIAAETRAADMNFAVNVMTAPEHTEPLTIEADAPPGSLIEAPGATIDPILKIPAGSELCP